MLFNYYDDLYITEDLKIIKTGEFKYKIYSGHYLTDVTVEENENEIKIHGYKRFFKYHEDRYRDSPFHITEDEWDKYCITNKDFYIKESGIFFKKYKKRLKSGTYMEKQASEICFCFHKTDVVEEYYTV